MEIGEWLCGLGLERYTDTFRAADVGLDVLPNLTEADLRELGVSLGDRRRLLKAALILQAQEGQVCIPSDATVASAERRQLTVMFVDLVGSTALSRQLDPEEMHGLIRRYQNAVAGEVARLEGVVAQFMGDGVLAFFGWPVAHEDAAERAVRAGLAITAAVAEISSPNGQPLAARVGIATGRVLVGDLVGTGEARRDPDVIGETPNLAARLQAVAEPDSVIVAEGTRRLLGGMFGLRELGAMSLKGFAEPVRAFVVIGEGVAEGRFEALHGNLGLTPLVGQEGEIAVLLDAWAQARTGRGRIVLVAGEAGIGKSRLVHELRQRLATEPYATLSQFCSPHHGGTTLYPLHGLIERSAGLSHDDPPERQIAKLEAMPTMGASETVPLLADMLGIPIPPGRYPRLELSPQQRKERTLRALLDQLTGLAAHGPVLALYEDAHWADPTTLELIDRVIERASSLAVLVVVTFRSEFSPSWARLKHVTTLALDRLDQRRSRMLVQGVSGGKPLPPAMLEQILDRTDGMPLFLEELTKSVMESGLLEDKGDRYELAGPLLPLAIPSTLQDSLMARLDRLAPVKEVAQLAAVIGREFSHELLAMVSARPDGELEDALRQIIAAGLVFPRGSPPRASYVFKHALIRDTAYHSLLRSRRQQAHAQIANVLEASFPAVADVQPELLAHHFTQAGLIRQAVAYWQKAGERASGQCAVVEATAHLERALSLQGTLPDGDERRRRELELQIALAAAVAGKEGYGAREAAQAWERARALCATLTERARLPQVLQGEFGVRIVRAEFERAHVLVAEFLKLGESEGSDLVRAMGHRALGTTLFHEGKLAQARGQLERALSLHDPERSTSFGFFPDVRMVGASHLALVLMVGGFLDQAQAMSDAALTRAQMQSHRSSITYARSYRFHIHLLRGNVQAAQAEAEAIGAEAGELGLTLFATEAKIFRGWALARTDQPGEGIALMRDGLAGVLATGLRFFVPHFRCLLADGYKLAGRSRPAALRQLSRGIMQAERTGEAWCRAELHRRRAELLAVDGDTDPAAAEAEFLRAIEIARAQEAKLWELRAATDLACFWRDQGRRAEACDLLAPIHAWFVEGHDTPDLIRAKELFETL